MKRILVVLALSFLMMGCSADNTTAEEAFSVGTIQLKGNYEGVKLGKELTEETLGLLGDYEEFDSYHFHKKYVTEKMTIQTNEENQIQSISFHRN